jgi:2-polyprenyl-6-methoxyphenol hydroxylase-like FAD-dependent oxidoreductase
VGGGIGGLTLAVALARDGWKVALHEKASTLRFEGFGIALSLRAQQVLAAIGIRDEVVAGRPPLRRREARNHRGGLVGYIQWPHTLYFIERTVLLDRLVELAERAGVSILTNSEVVDVDPRGIVRFKTGDEREADLIVGADGVYSVTRAHVDAQSSLELLSYGAARALIPRAGFENLLGGETWAEYWSGKRRLFVAPISQDGIYLALNCSRKDALQGETSASDWRVPLDLNVWQTEFPCLAALIATISEKPLWAPFPQVSVNSWVRDRLALIGDAAHAMAPALGAGGATAMMDAVSLSLVLRSASSVEEGLQTWQRTHRPSILRLQRDSRFWGDVGYWPNFVQKALLNLTPHSNWLQHRRFISLDYLPDVVKSMNLDVSNSKGS